MPFVIDGDRLSQLIQVLKDERREVSAIEQLCPSAALDPLDNYRFLRQYVLVKRNAFNVESTFLNQCVRPPLTPQALPLILRTLFTLSIF